MNEIWKNLMASSHWLNHYVPGLSTAVSNFFEAIEEAVTYQKVKITFAQLAVYRAHQQAQLRGANTS